MATDQHGYDVAEIRSHFPALALTQDGEPLAFFDGPGGTQVPREVIDAVTGYYTDSNANDGGAFLTSQRSDEIIRRAHLGVAEFLNARSGHEIKFGANMTTLTFHISRSIGKTLKPGDEIVVTTLDHEANVSPWRAMAEDRDVTVRTVDIHPEDGTLDLDDLDRKLSDRTRLVAVGYASNALGTINPVAEIIRRAHAVGALVVHRRGPFRAARPDRRPGARHRLPRLLGVQVLRPAPRRPVRQGGRARRAAGLQGPAGARPLRDGHAELRGDRRCARRRSTTSPGSANASAAAYEAEFPGLSGRRLHLKTAMRAIRAYELELFGQLVDGLDQIPGAHLWGITDRARFARAHADGRGHVRRADAAGRRRGARPAGDDHLGRRLLRPGADRAARAVRVRRRPADRARPLQHGRRGRSTRCGPGRHRRRGQREAAA